MACIAIETEFKRKVKSFATKKNQEKTKQMEQETTTEIDDPQISRL
jgi:hypothetical protein